MNATSNPAENFRFANPCSKSLYSSLGVIGHEQVAPRAEGTRS